MGLIQLVERISSKKSEDRARRQQNKLAGTTESVRRLSGRHQMADGLRMPGNTHLWKQLQPRDPFAKAAYILSERL